MGHGADLRRNEDSALARSTRKMLPEGARPARMGRRHVMPPPPAEGRVALPEDKATAA
jgi:hypothetical protein